MKTLSSGEVVVRDDLKYPEGALVVDGFDANGDLLAHPLGGGFQFTVPAEEIDRFHRVGDAESIPVFTRGTFQIEGIDGDFEGWSDGTFWNGWEKPCFTREVAERVLQSCGHKWSYDAASDTFDVYSSGEEEPEQFCGESVQLGDGGTAKAYFIGAGSWIWDKI
jgi:hypothetical protein